MQPSQRLGFLSTLRAIAALAVFFSHLGERVWPAYSHFVHAHFDLGNFGVVLFFLCSGFVVPASLERQGSLRSFWVRRFFRLYPLYWLSIALSIALAYSTSRATPAAFLSANAAMILGNLTMLQMFFGIEHIRAEFWTLMFEMAFYLALSLLFLARSLRNMEAATVALLLATLLVEGLPALLGMRKPPLGTVGYLAIMFAGTVLYRMYVDASYRLRGASIIVLALFVSVASKLVGPPTAAASWEYYRFMLTELAAYAVFALFAFGLGARSFPRPAVYLGDISYSIYLMQTYVLWYSTGSSLADIAVWTIGIVVVSALTYELVERPFIRLSQRLAPASRRQPSPARAPAAAD